MTPQEMVAEQELAAQETKAYIAGQWLESETASALAPVQAELDDAKEQLAVALESVSELQEDVVLLQQKVKELQDIIDAGNEEPVEKQKYGVSGSISWPANYLEQIDNLHANCAFYYSGYGPRDWSKMGSIPETHDIWYETKDATKAQYVAMLDTFPAEREGKLYLHYMNEPDAKITKGDLTLAEFQQRCDWLFEAIEESGLDYVVPSIELTFWSLAEMNNGSTSPHRNIDNYVRPGLKHIGWSAYSGRKVVNGHEVAKFSPVKMPKDTADYMNTLADKGFPGIGWSVAATGWAQSYALADDPVSVQNRVDWLRAASANFANLGSKHFMWFDVNWNRGDNPGDYRITSDPDLMTAWRELLEAEGQW